MHVVDNFADAFGEVGLVVDDVDFAVRAAVALVRRENDLHRESSADRQPCKPAACPRLSRKNSVRHLLKHPFKNGKRD
jgi:hypothetical protein